MKLVKFSKTLVAAAVMAAATGCTTIQNADKVKFEAERSANSAVARSATANVMPSQREVVKIERRAYIPVEEVGIDPVMRFKRANDGVDVRVARGTLRTVADDVFKDTGVVLSMDDETASIKVGKLRYRGTLGDFLKLLEVRYGVNASIESDNRVALSKEITRVFNISALPGGFKQAAELSNVDGVGSVHHFSAANVWRSLEGALTKLLGEDGFSLSPDTGLLTVKADAATMKSVESLVRKYNDALSTAVMVNVETYAVTVEDSDEFGVDLNAVYRTLAANLVNGAGLDFRIQSVGQTSAAAGTTAIGVIGNTEWNGSQILFKSLGSKARISQISSRTILTLNNMPAPFSIGSKVSYVKEIGSNLSNGVAQTTLKQGEVDTGYYLSVLPHVINSRDGELLMNVMMTSSSLTDIKTVQAFANGDFVQTPELARQSMTQNIRMRSGEMLMVASYDSEGIASRMAGMLDAEHIGAGGSTAGSKSKTYLFMFIKPVVEKRR